MHLFHWRYAAAWHDLELSIPSSTKFYVNVSKLALVNASRPLPHAHKLSTIGTIDAPSTMTSIQALLSTRWQMVPILWTSRELKVWWGGYQVSILSWSVHSCSTCIQSSISHLPRSFLLPLFYLAFLSNLCSILVLSFAPSTAPFNIYYSSSFWCLLPTIVNFIPRHRQFPFHLLFSLSSH